MPREQFVNDVATTLDGGINNTDTSLTLTSGTGFPSVHFRIRIDDEIIIVTSRSGETCYSLVRGAEGTTAASHSDDAAVNHVLTAGALTKLKRENGTDVQCYYENSMVIGDSMNIENQYVLAAGQYNQTSVDSVILLGQYAKAGGSFSGAVFESTYNTLGVGGAQRFRFTGALKTTDSSQQYMKWGPGNLTQIQAVDSSELWQCHFRVLAADATPYVSIWDGYFGATWAGYFSAVCTTYSFNSASTGTTLNGSSDIKLTFSEAGSYFQVLCQNDSGVETNWSIHLDVVSMIRPIAGSCGSGS